MLLYALVQYIETNGIDLKIEDGRLRVAGDQSKLTPDITDAMRAHKQALMAWCARQAGGIPRAESVDGSFPLSLAQQRLYFLYQYDPSVTSFILPVELELRGAIDIARFRGAIVAAVSRHEIYRAVYVVEDGMPRQRIDRDRAFDISLLDVSALDAEARDAALARTRQSVTQTPFDLGAELPLRVCIVRESDDFHRLVVAMHHIATDDWSIQQFVKEVADAYRDGGERQAEPPSISYLDYAAWQAETYAQGGYDVSRSYWLSNLDGIRGVLELPLDAARPAVQTFNGATVTRRISADLGGRAAAVARALKTTEFSLYLGAFNVLMSKLTGERDIVVGTDVFGRDHDDLQAMAGFFVNQVALRSRVEPTEAVGAYLARLGMSTLESLRYQDMPFDKLVDALGIERDTAYSPIFQVKFLYDRAPHRIQLFDDVDVQESHVFPVKSQYDITLKVVGDEAIFYYNTDLFRAGTVALWADLYMEMLERAIAAPSTPIAGLLHDTLAERLEGWIDGERVEVDASALFAGYDRMLRETPEAVAVRTADCAVTYAELDARVVRIAARLLAMGVRKGAKVAVHLERSVDLVAAIVAVLRSGAVFVPIDPSYPREHIDYTLEDSGAGVVISDGALAEGLSEFYGFVLDIDQLPSTPVAAPAWPEVSADDIAYLLYTSGSTGRPKGALVSHGAFSNLCDWYIRFAGLDVRSRTLLMIPIGFDASIKNVVCPLMVGGVVVLARAGAFDPDALLDQIEDAGVTLINCAPSAMNAILKMDASNDYARLASLEMLALGGEALDIGVFSPWLSSRWCRATLANIYGPTECTDISVAWKADRDTWMAQAVAPIGHPIQNARACIVDAELQLCPPGVAGELLIAGRGVGAGYHHLDDATAHSFIDSPVAGGRAYRTGDICRYDADGRIVYVGRSDGQIKIRGKRVEISEIVAQLSECLPSRKISVQLYAEGELEMLLAFVDGGAASPSADEVRRELSQRLPRHMVPAQILFVDALPLTPNGKVDTRALAAHFEANRVASDVASEPLDETEEAIAAVWRELLGVGELGKSSDFFALGGDSIFSIQLVAKLREHGMPVAVADIFKYPTIGQLAAFVRGQGAVANVDAGSVDGFVPTAPFSLVNDSDRARLPDGLEDAYPLTALQHGMIFHALMDEGGSTYHDVFSFELGFDRYDEEAFVRAIEAVVSAHPVLRTGFDLSGYSVPLQLVHARVSPNIERHDLRDSESGAQQGAIADTIVRIKACGFDLDAPSLIRFTLLRLSEHVIQLLIDAHHAILDGWSMATLQRQVFDTYRAAIDGTPKPSFDHGVSRFADYVALVERETADPASFAYWAGRARNAGEGRIARTAAAPQGREFREIRLEDGLAAQLDALAVRESVPVRTLLLVAHAFVVRAMIGVDRIVTGQTDNGRLEVAGSENVLGLFLNVLPKTFDFACGSWRELARAVHEDETESRPYRRYPLAEVVRRHPAMNVDSLFTFTNFRVSNVLTRQASLRVREGDMFEQVNFPLSIHANGNREDGYSVVLDARLNLCDMHLDALLHAYLGALEAMIRNFDATMPDIGPRFLPTFACDSDGARGLLVHFNDAFDESAFVVAARTVSHRALGIDDGLQWVAPTVGAVDETTLVSTALSAASALDAPLAAMACTHEGRRILVVRIAQRLLQAEPDAAAALMAQYRLLVLAKDDFSVRAMPDSPWRPASVFERDLAYWRTQLSGAPLRTALPGDRDASLSARAEKACFEFSVGTEIGDALRAASASAGMTEEAMWVAGWIALLASVCGEDDVAIGFASSSLEPAILRLPLAFDAATATLVAAAASAIGGAKAHADLPYAQRNEALHAGVDVNIALLFGAVEPTRFPDSELVLSIDHPSSCRLHYCGSRFEPETIERLADRLLRTMAWLTADTTCPVADLPLLSTAERECVLTTFNATRTDAPAQSLVHRWFEEQVAQRPQAQALIDGDQTLSYAELDRRANRIAHRLIGLGVKPDDLVAICVERSAAMVAGLLGILKAGGGYVPLDPAYPIERLNDMLEDSAPVAIVTLSNATPAFADAGTPTLILERGGELVGGNAEDKPCATPVVDALAGQHLAYVIYTSGSTGRPKGVMVEHRNVSELIRNQIALCGLQPGERVLQFASYAFDASVEEIFPTLAVGGTLVLRPDHLIAPNREFVDFLASREIAVADLPTAFWHRWSQEAAQGRLSPPAGLRLVIIGGEKVERRHLQSWLSMPGMRCAILNTYGPTEATVYATAAMFGAGIELPPRDVTIGAPVGNTRLYILDARGEPAPIGVAGELCIAGAQVARGYLHRDALTSEQFVRDPFSNEADARMYRTGDLGRWRSDGTIEYVGRNDFQVKIRGFRIELGEIESRLSKLAGVREAVVLAREDVEGDKRLVAYVVPAEGATLEVAALREGLSKDLAEYMIPSAFVMLERMPLTPNVKIDRKALPAPGASAFLSRAFVAPQGYVEEILATVWREILSVERVSRNDHFFELGGHSLLVIGLIERLRRHGLEMSVRDIFAAPSLAGMAEKVVATADENRGAKDVPPNLIAAGTTTITPELLPLATLSQDEIDGIVARVPGGVSNIQDIYPLAPLQKGILFHHILEEDTGGDSYLLRLALSFDTRERLDVFLSALQQVIDRHDILRSGIFWEGLSEPMQVVYRRVSLSLRELALSPGEDALQQILLQMDPAAKRLDLAVAPIIEICAGFDSEAGQWVLALLYHHITCDHVAMELVMEEITALLESRGDTLAAPVPYRNFIAHAQAAAGDDAEHEAYFRAELGDVEEPTAPFGIHDVQIDSVRIEETYHPFDADLSQRILSSARRHGVSPSVLFHVGWAQVLAQCTGRDDVVFGTVLSGRLQGSEGADRVVGMFLNTLPLRVRLGERDADTLVKDTYARLSGLLVREQASLPLAQRCSQVQPPLPLFTTLLNYRHNAGGDAHQDETLVLDGVHMLAGSARNNYPLTMSVEDWGDSFGLTTLTAPGIDGARVVGYMQTAMIALVDALEAGATTPLSLLSILPSAERAQVLHGFQDLRVDAVHDRTVHAVFEARVRAHPDAEAVRYGDEVLTYAELNARANRVAHRLIALGVRPDDRVAICADRGVAMLVAIVGVWKSGGGYVPLDPSYPLERLAYMLSDSGPKAVVTTAAELGSLPMLSEAGVPVVMADDGLLDASAANPQVEGLGPRSLAYVIYTSGSTGQPKGVMVEHRSPVNFWRVMEQTTHAELKPQSRVGLNAAFSFDMSLKGILQLLSGHCVVPVPQSIRASGAEMVAFMERERIDAQDSTPSQLQVLLDAGLLAGGGHRPTSIYLGGEPVGLKLWETLKSSERIHFHNMYGPTECTVDATIESIRHSIGGPVIGKPIMNVPVYVLDATLEPVPVGVPGELYLGGVQVARGYLDREELTQERFVRDPFSSEADARMYRTGDLGRWRSDGRLEYLGRNDFQVKIRGFRIELGEIESRLSKLAGVREAVVLAREDVEGDQRLVAYVVPAEGATLEVAALREGLSKDLAEYMIPSAFVVLERLPLTPNGKLDRKALPAPDGSAVASRAYEAPVGEVEEVIAAIWGELLNLERVGRNDHFFELGGHSLLVIGLIERARQRGLTLDVRDIFTTPVLHAMACGARGEDGDTAVAGIPPNLITSNTTAITPELLPLVSLSQDEIDGIVARVPGGVSNIQDIYPLAPLQKGILFHHILEEDTGGDTYLLKLALSFDTRERLDVFLSTLQQVIDRHDILRSGIAWQGLSEPVQVVYRIALLSIREEVLSPDRDALEQLLARANPNEHRLDLGRAPILRAHVGFDAQKDQWIMALLRHHITCDHVAMALVLEEITALLESRGDTLAAPVPYRNFIAHAQAAAGDDAEHEAYFRAELGDVEEPTAPFGILDVQTESEQIQETQIAFDLALAQRILSSARRHGVSPSVLFHVGWAQVLAQCTGRDDVVFGTVLSGRLQGSEGADRVVGMFLNTLPLRVRLGERDADTLVKDTYARLSGLLVREQASLPLAQRCSQVQPPLPLFTTLLNYRHNAGGDAHQDETLVLDGVHMLAGSARNNYPLTMSVEDWGDSFGLTTLTAPGIDGARVVGYMQTAMIALVDALEAGATTPLSLLSILPSAERAQVLHGFQDLRVDAVHDRTVHAVFEARVRAHPDAEAVRYGDEVLTYAELNARANRVAHRLIALGVRPDDRVAICADRGVAMLVAIMGVWKSGGGYVPLDPSYPLERLAYMLSDSGPKAVVTTAAELGSLPMLSEAGVPVVMADDGLLDASAANPQVEGLGPRSLAYVIYTSGSTGQPKGVMVEHRSPVNFWRVMEQTTHAELKPQSRVGLNAAFSFDMSLKGILQLLSGHCVVPVPQSIRASGAEMVAFMERERIDAQDSTPSQLQVLLDAGLLAGGGHRPTSIYLGGEPVGLKLWETLKSSERIHFHNMYGPTECTVDATIESIRHSMGGPVIGKPIMNVPVYVLDATLEPVPVGVPGELYLGGVQVARGYLDREELTQERFVRDPFSNEADARMYRTGDLGRWRSDGRLEYLGRNDFQVKIRGFRIELGEIESRLSKLAGVREAVVLAREDVEGDQRLVAYVVPAEGATLEVAALREGLSKDLAEYMIPSAFVVLERLPLTPNGKLDRKALPAPDGSAVASRAYEAPVGEVEEVIAAIWGELLNLERVGRNDHFFELGGHSLLVIGLIERARQRGLTLDVRDIFTTPVLHAMACGARGEDGDTAVAGIPPNLITSNTTAITPELLPLVSLSQDEIDGIVARVPGGVSNIQDIYPLAPLQKGILFHHLLEQDTNGDTYLLRLALSFDTRERLDVFLSTLQQVIDRHDILRSGIVWQGLSEPVQVVHRRALLPIREVVLSPDREALPQLLAQVDPNARRLDLSSAPILDAVVAHDAGHGRWLLGLMRHHITCDHVAMALVLNEIERLIEGRGETLSTPVPYRNFIAMSRADAADDAEHETYFRAELGDVDEPTAPFGVLDVQTDSERIVGTHVPLGDALSRRLHDAARRHGVSPSVLFHVGWSQVLAQCTGRDDVVFGTVLSGRLGGSEGADRVVGMFLNTLPLRVRLSDRTAGEVVRDTYDRLSQLLMREQASLPLAQRCSSVQAPLPLFTTLMNYRHNAGGDEQVDDETRVFDGVHILASGARNNYPLTMSIEDGGEHFGLTLLSAPGIDGARVVGYMQTAMIALVDALEAGATTPLSLLSILPSAERAQVLHGFQDLRVDAVHDRTVHAVFEARVRAHPDAEAVRYGDEVLTYAELNARANRVAHRLIALGVRPDDRVAICADRGVAMLVAIVGVWKSGGGYVPLDPSYPLERLAYMLSDSGPKAVVTTAAELGSLPMLSEAGVPVVMADDGLLDASAANPQVEGLGPRSLAYVIYTSGSTGQPKGVMVEHRSPVNFWRVMEQTTHAELKPQSRVGLNAAFSFDMSLKGILQLLSGHCVVPVPQSIRASGAEMVAFMERERIDAQDSTPSQLQVLLDAGLLAGGGHRPTSIYLGGEPVGLKLWETLKSSERIHFHNMYGPTECTVDATIESIRHSIGGPVIGKPIMNVPVYVLDATLEPVPVGVPGELYLGGVQVARGYLDREELTQERFVRDPFSSEADARMYRTGDLGRWRSDGRLEYLGRNDFQVKIRGFRIELGEIESRLSKLAGVREAVVLAREDVEGDQRLVAYVVPAEGATLEVAALREGLSKDLAEYMIPSAFVVLERLPLTPNGKLDRKALPAPDGSAVASRAYEAPVGEVEEVIAAIWGELLNLERVGRNDHFFELGGHSLLVMQLVVRMRERFDVELPLRELFEKPVLSNVAEHVVAARLLHFAERDVTAMADELSDLSEEELLAMLAEDATDDR